jgi:Fur family ferric uptake transcriptional regulator
MTAAKFQRNTQQRKVMLEELRKTHSHPTATELYEIVRRRLPKISLGTVYRNLELLTEMGAIRKLEIFGKEARFDGDLERHYHVRCERCSRVDDFVSVFPVQAIEEARDMNGWKILGRRVEFVGICPECQYPCEAGVS